MEIIDYFDVGETVSVEQETETDKKHYECVVKKIKEDMLALTFPSPPALPDAFSANAPLIVTFKKETRIFRLSFLILSSRTFPVIIMKFKEELPSISEPENYDNDEEDIDHLKVNDINNNKKITERNSARVEDSFLIKYEFISKEMAETIKKDYILKPTSLRQQKDSSTSDFQVLNKQENLSSISHLDPALIGVIKDIYFRIHMLASISQASGLLANNKNLTGHCVDISGTGLKLLTTKPYTVGNILRIIISPPKANPFFTVTLIGEVKRMEKNKSKDGQSDEYTLGIGYFAIHEDDMEEITRYTFQLQQEFLRQRRIKKGLE